ncbi:unnamed protein product [Nippostrongylus brasiliensis]|uniref:Transthyretin-like family protein n=1 Tax=Nippostrongylus brasiliensis TaxID=27835 RepID=A0A0N4XXJ8_NIPBR|nr:unnamed protein product [Nippostrongylus brasiliensis]
MGLLKLLLLLQTIALACEAFRTQSVAVKGKLMCGSQPAVNVQVKLLDEDHGDPDDVMDQVFTKSDGLFNLSGFASELTPIDPELRIFHDCNDHGKPCQREWRIRIPSNYIFSGSQPERPMDLGTMNLEVRPDPDDVLDSGYTDANGFFELAGSTAERTTIDPHLKFYHDCNDGITVSESS